MTDQSLGMQLTRLSDVEPERVSWLWPGRIPLGKLVTLDGDPGLGKSTLALEIAACVTRAHGKWPDGMYCEHPGDVILLSAEDGLADTTRPRADAAQADVTRIHALEGLSTVEQNGEVVLRPPTLGDVVALEDAIVQTGARLLVVDVLMAYLPTGADSHKDQDIRRVLTRLAAVADRTGCTVLLLRHLNKAKGGDPMYRGGGSIGIVGAARSGMLVAPDPDDPERRVLASVKSNLGPAPDSLTYRLVGVGDHGVARVQWEGSTTHTAHTLLAEPHDEDAGAATEAEQWLHDYLTEQGAAPSKSVKAAAAKVGIAERTLKRASNSLRVVVDSRGFPRVTWWVLPSQASTMHSDPGAQNLGPTGPTGAEQPKCNGPTGLISQSGQAEGDGPTGATEPETQSRQLIETGAAVPGGITESTPGQTDRVKQALEKAKSSALLLCPECTRAPARSDTGICDFCTAKARRQAVALEVANLTPNGQPA
ncbi:AAA family ATPase [Mycobacterium antarcticum]|uniref:AAA family ATPase n=1 Tax=Mycolicibacterium sp. TUM20984 TaxID=3023368 RepID=UPI002397AF98|nr:AAA family ATPase [Mycolicibacterium sp. TUM20984]GLP83565.1 hypothetical protein TUM20984_49850 [Mycolicibacterium sp. TUM20984]